MKPDQKEMLFNAIRLLHVEYWNIIALNIDIGHALSVLYNAVHDNDFDMMREAARKIDGMIGAGIEIELLKIAG